MISSLCYFEMRKHTPALRCGVIHNGREHTMLREDSQWI